MKKYSIYQIAIGILFIVLINFPIFYFYLNDNKDLHFLSRRSVEQQTTYSYVSLIEQAKQKGFVIENLFTTDKQKSFINNPSYIIGGIIAKIFNISSITIYNLERLLFSLLFLYSLSKFLSKLSDNDVVKLTIYFVILGFTGIGNLISILNSNSPTFLIPQSNIFMTLMDAPHYILSISFLLFGFYFLLSFLESRKNKFISTAGLLFLFAGFEYPFLLPLISLVAFVLFYLSKLGVSKSLGFTLICSIGLPFFFLSYVNNPFWRLWEETSIFASPTPLQIFFEYGFLIVPAIFGIEEFLNRNGYFEKLILIWTFINLILLFSPTPLQIKFLEGFVIPLSILAVVGAFKIIKLIKMRWAHFLIIIWIVILSIPSAYLLISDFKIINSDNANSYNYNISNAEYDGMSWLGNNTNINDAILSNWFFGNLIPGITGQRVYLGHQVLTPNFDAKVTSINSFLLEQNDLVATSFLKTNKISYIFLGNFDSMLQYGFKPDNKSYLKKVYSKNGAEIYKVKIN